MPAKKEEEKPKKSTEDKQKKEGKEVVPDVGLEEDDEEDEDVYDPLNPTMADLMSGRYVSVWIFFLLKFT